LDYASDLIASGAVGVFSKGENAELELTDSTAAATYEITTLPSRTLPTARLVLVRRRVNALETA
jgi:16S rRNA (guanine527-N7)-methyltransferase